MKEQAKAYLREAIGKIEYPINNVAEAKTESAWNNLKAYAEAKYREAFENSPSELRNSILEVLNEYGSVIDLLEGSEIPITFEVPKNPSGKKIDVEAETEKYYKISAEFKDAGILMSYSENITEEKVQNYWNITAQLKEQMQFMIDNDVVIDTEGNVPQSFLDAFSTFKEIEISIKEFAEKHNFALDTRTNEEIQQEYQKAFDSAEKQVLEELSKICKSSYHKGNYEITPSSYDDVISESTVLKHFNDFSELVKQKSDEVEGLTFADYLDNALFEDFFDTVIYYENEVYGEFIREFSGSDKYNELAEKFGEDIIENVMREIDPDTSELSVGELAERVGLSVTVDVPSFLKYDFHINVVFNEKLDGKEGTATETLMLYAQNPDDFHFNHRKEETLDLINTPVSYLVQQQGFKIDEMVYESEAKVLGVELDNDLQDNNFVSTFLEETEDYCSYPQLSAFFTASGNQLLEFLDVIAHKDTTDKVFELESNTRVGFTDLTYNGDCSALGIELEKDFVFPADMIRYIQIEKGGKSENKGVCTIDELCGLVSDFWEGELSIEDAEEHKEEIETARTISEQTVDNVHAYLETFFEGKLFDKNDEQSIEGEEQEFSEPEEDEEEYNFEDELNF